MCTKAVFECTCVRAAASSGGRREHVDGTLPRWRTTGLVAASPSVATPARIGGIVKFGVFYESSCLRHHVADRMFREALGIELADRLGFHIMGRQHHFLEVTRCRPLLRSG